MSLLDPFTNFDPCEPEKLNEELEKAWDEFTQEVKDTFKYLTSISFGPFIVTMFALMKQMVKGAAINFLTFMGSMLLGNIIGGLTTLVGLAVSLVAGIQIMVR